MQKSCHTHLGISVIYTVAMSDCPVAAVTLLGGLAQCLFFDAVTVYTVV